MGKRTLHIQATQFKLWLLWFCLIINAFAFAQAPDYSPLADTVLDKDSFNHFEKLTTADAVIPQHRIIAESIVNQLKRHKDFWYASQPPTKKKAQAPNQRLSFYLQPWFKNLLWVLITCSFMAIIIWYLMVSDVRLFRSSSSLLQQGAEEPISDDIFSIDYTTEIGKATAEHNYRMAVRLMYLHILWLMVQRNIIQYKIEKTNTDYLLQLHGTSYYKDFLRLTRNFEYTWYGKFAVSAPAFDRIQKDYQTFKSRLHT